jgi:hypothetical protein
MNRLASPVTGDMVTFELHLRTVEDVALEATKFENVRRLIELHWLEGFPLWGTLTRLREFKGWEDRDNSNSLFGDWLYQVRQIVALYRIDRQTWRDTSIAYIKDYELVANDLVSSSWEEASDADLVEAVIRLLTNAIEYHLGYKGKYSVSDRDGKDYSPWDSKPFLYEIQFAKVAKEREYAVVHVVRLYYENIDGFLRAQLGDGYDK